MIEINLVPDVKQELIRAQGQRTAVISGAILVALASAGAIVALCLWVFAGQTIHMNLLRGQIDDKQKEIQAITDLPSALTIQNQFAKLSEVHASRNIDSRLFNILTTIAPGEPNEVQVSNASVDSEAKTITIEAQAAAGFSALETYKKTIEATNVTYTLPGGEGVDGERKTVPLAENVADVERSFGEDANGRQVLRFVITFNYTEDLFSPKAKNVTVVAPTKRNATDSYLAVPDSLFAPRAADTEEEN